MKSLIAVMPVFVFVAGTVWKKTQRRHAFQPDLQDIEKMARGTVKVTEFLEFVGSDEVPDLH